MVDSKVAPFRDISIQMRQADQDKWVSRYEAWQLKLTRRIVRRTGALVGWLNILHFTDLVSYLASHLIDPFFAWLTGMSSKACAITALCMAQHQVC